MSTWIEKTSESSCMPISAGSHDVPPSTVFHGKCGVPALNDLGVRLCSNASATTGLSASFDQEKCAPNSLRHPCSGTPRLRRRRQLPSHPWPDGYRPDVFEASAVSRRHDLPASSLRKMPEYSCVSSASPPDKHRFEALWRRRAVWREVLEGMERESRKSPSFADWEHQRILVAARTTPDRCGSTCTNMAAPAKGPDRLGRRLHSMNKAAALTRTGSGSSYSGQDRADQRSFRTLVRRCRLLRTAQNADRERGSVFVLLSMTEDAFRLLGRTRLRPGDTSLHHRTR